MHTVRADHFAGAELIADEEVIDDVLYFIGVQQDMATPPALETQVAGNFGVDVGIQVVLLGPKCVGRIEIFEIANQPGAVELAVPQIAGQRRQPTAAQQPACIAHGIDPPHTRPVRQRRADQNDRAAKLWPFGRQHHQRPPCLAVADHDRFAFGIGMQFSYALDKYPQGIDDGIDGLSGLGRRRKADIIAVMTLPKGLADLAFRFEAADAGSVARARIDNHEGAFVIVEHGAGRRLYLDDAVIHGLRQGSAVHNQLIVELQHMRGFFSHVFPEMVAAPAHYIPVKNRFLAGIHQVSNIILMDRKWVEFLSSDH